MDWIVTAEHAGDVEARERLLDVELGAGRKLVACEALREGNTPAIALAARETGSLIGTVRLWPVSVPGAGAVLMLGPLAVTSLRSGRGIGSALMEAALDRAEAEGWDAVILVGAPGYYARFGFEPVEGISMPGRSSPGRCLVGLELRPGALATAHGRVMPLGETYDVAA